MGSVERWKENDGELDGMGKRAKGLQEEEEEERGRKGVRRGDECGSVERRE